MRPLPSPRRTAAEGRARLRGRGASADASAADPGSSPALDVDWAAAGRWGGRLASPGPGAERDELVRLVEDLHDAARRAVPLALRAARLARAVEAAGASDVRAAVHVVDRPTWARAAGQSFAALAVAPGTAAGTAPGTAAGAAQGAGASATDRGATLQVAGLLGVLAGRVLGQFDPFGGAPDDEPGGRLLLVAPNVLRTERAMGAEPADFRLWVCVHEQTHALQFAAAPWLADHLRSEIGALVAELGGAGVETGLGAAVRATTRAIRGEDAADGDDLGILGAALDPAQRARVDRLTAVMSLHEGHADVSMDSVGVRTIPSARRLRARLDARRTSGGLDRVLRRVLGLDAKLAQYRRGAAFVRAARRAGGRDALDAAWTGPDALPTPREIADPRAWVRRVHG